MKKIYAFSLLVIVAFALRALVFWGYLGDENRYWQVDSATYETLAKELAINERFATPDGTPNAYRLPGYPLFLAMIFKAVGVNHHAALWVQIILASLIPLLVFFLAQVLFPRRRRIAWGGAFITTCHLGYVLYSGFMMSETLFIFFFLLFLIPFCRAVLRADAEETPCMEEGGCKQLSTSSNFYNLLALNPAAKGQDFVRFYDELLEPDVVYSCYVRKPEDSEGMEIFFAGAMLGFASLIRPVGHYLVVVTAIILFFAGSHRFKQLGECTVLGFGWFIVVGGWLVRNSLVFGHVFFHTLPGGHFLYLSAARVLAAEQHVSYEDARAQLRFAVETQEAAALEEKGESLSAYEVCKIHEKMALATFCSAPLTSIKFWLQDMFRAAASLYSAELLYLESDRKQIDYFATGRSMSSWFERYLKPATEKSLLKAVVWSEILFHGLLLLGVAFFVLQALFKRVPRKHKILWLVSPFIGLFIVISLSGGYARMRLPAEFLLIILALASVGWFYKDAGRAID